MILLAWLLLLSCTTIFSFAQDGNRIIGYVMAATDSAPLAGATVSIKGSTIVTKTDANGRFSLIRPGLIGSLSVSFIGFQNKEINLMDVNGLLQIKLMPVDNLLDETVVIAYGHTTKRLNTGNVSRVTAKDIALQPVGNPLLALQGRMPGVEITQTSGVPGRTVEVQIRGRNSIASGNGPLYLVDGVPWLGTSLSQLDGTIGQLSPLSSLNPNDILSIDVLKDADATAIYGSRGANGVILITTKKGLKGKTSLAVNVYTGFSKVAHTMDIMNTQQYLAMRREAFKNDDVVPTNGNAPDLLLYDTTRYTDWKKLFIGNTAHLHDAQLSLTGGQANTQFRLSGGFRKEGTVFPGDLHHTRGTGTLNITHSAWQERAKLDISVSYTKDNNNLINRDLTNDIFSIPNQKLYEDDGELAWSENGSGYRFNPLATLLSTARTSTDNINLNLNARFRLMEGLDFIWASGLVKTILNEKNIAPKGTYLPSAGRISGGASFGDNMFNSWIIEPHVTYNHKIGLVDMNILLGTTLQQETTAGKTIAASNFNSESLLESLSAAAQYTATSQYALYRYQAVFGRINLNKGNKYLLNLTARRDGSSRFGPGKQFALLGAVGSAWIFSEESFMKSIAFLSYGKLRASYGITGSDNIGNYQYLDSYGAVSSSLQPYQGVSALIPKKLYNADYGWETNRKLEAALDVGFFHDRLLFSLSAFRNRSGNQLVKYRLPGQTGFTSITRNLDAVVQNKGLEIGVDATPVQKDGFKWNVSFNMTIARNKLLSFPEIESSSYAGTYEIGQPLNIRHVYPYLGVDSETGIYTFDKANGRNVVKNVDASFYGGLNNTVQYKKFQMHFFFQFSKRPNVLNYIASVPGAAGLLGVNAPVAMLDRWQRLGDESEIQRFTVRGDALTARTYYINYSDGVFTDGSFIRLKNIALSYNLPKAWCEHLKTKNLRIYLQAQNVLTWTPYKGNDPEVPSLTTLPPLRTLTAGMQLVF